MKMPLAIYTEFKAEMIRVFASHNVTAAAVQERARRRSVSETRMLFDIMARFNWNVVSAAYKAGLNDANIEVGLKKAFNELIST